jgi:hypothetical protein
MALSLAYRPLCGVNRGPKRSGAPASRAAPSATARTMRLAPPARAQCGPGSFYYGGGGDAEQARRAMRDMMNQMAQGGFAWPGGRVWFDMNMGDSAGGEPASFAAAARGAPAARLPVDLLKEVR